MASPLTKPPAVQNPAFEEYRKTMLNSAGERYTGRGTRMRRGEMAGMDQGQAEEHIRSSYAKSVAADDAKASGKSSLAAEFSTPKLDAMSGAVTKRMEDRANMRDVTTGREQAAMDDAKQQQWDAMTAPARAEAETGMGADPGDTMNPVDPLDNAQPSPLAKPGIAAQVGVGVGGGVSAKTAKESASDTIQGDAVAVTGGNDAISGGGGMDSLPSPVTKPTGSAAVFQKFRDDYQQRKARDMTPKRDLAFETAKNNLDERTARMGKANNANREADAARWAEQDKVISAITNPHKDNDSKMKAAQANVDMGRAKVAGIQANIAESQQRTEAAQQKGRVFDAKHGRYVPGKATADSQAITDRAKAIGEKQRKHEVADENENGPLRRKWKHYANDWISLPTNNAKRPNS